MLRSTSMVANETDWRATFVAVSVALGRSHSDALTDADLAPTPGRPSPIFARDADRESRARAIAQTLKVLMRSLEAGDTP